MLHKGSGCLGMFGFEAWPGTLCCVLKRITEDGFQAAELAPSMEQIKMLSEQLPKASLLKLYVSQLDRARKNPDMVSKKFKREDGYE